MKFFLKNIFPLIIAGWYTLMLCIPSTTWCSQIVKPLKIKVYMINSAGKTYDEVKSNMNLNYWQTGQYSYEVNLSTRDKGWKMTARPHTKKIYRSNFIERILFLDFSSRNLPDLYMDSNLEYPVVN